MSLIYEFPFPPSGGDDTSVIQTAIDCLKNSCNGGAEFIFRYYSSPYLVTTLQIPSNIVIIGNGVTIKQFAGSYNAPILMLNAVNNINISGLSIDGNKYEMSPDGGGSYNFYNGIAIYGGNNIVLENLIFLNIIKRGILVWEENPETHFYSKNISILNCTGFEIGNAETGCWATFIDCCFASNVYIDNIVIDGIYGVGSGIVNSNDIIINNFKCKNNTFDDGISIAGCTNVKVSNCIFENIAHCGVEINTTTNFEITNIKITYSYEEEPAELPLYGILISTYVDSQYPLINGVPSKSGLIQNIQFAIDLPYHNANYCDLLITGSQNFTLFNIVSLHGVKFGYTTIDETEIYSQNMHILNSSISDLYLIKCTNIFINNNLITNLLNTASSYNLNQNYNGMDLFFKQYVANGATATFYLPNLLDSTVSDDPAIIFGTLAIDNSFAAGSQSLQFTSKLLHVRAQATGDPISLYWASQLISSLDGYISGKSFDYSLIKNQIQVYNSSGVDTYVRVNLKIAFDKYY